MAWISRSQELPQGGNMAYSPMPTCGGSDEFESTPLDISLLLEPQTQAVHPITGSSRQSIPVHWDIKDRGRGQSPESIMQFPEFLIKKSPSRTSEAEIAESEKRVTIWNWKEKRKLSGNSAPFKRNLQRTRTQRQAADDRHPRRGRTQLPLLQQLQPRQQPRHRRQYQQKQSLFRKTLKLVNQFRSVFAQST